MAARPCKSLADELEIRGDVVVGGVVAGERFAEVENEIAVELGQGVEALQRAVELVQRRLVLELRERVDDFVFDFFLVERADERRFAVRARRRLLQAPTIS